MAKHLSSFTAGGVKTAMRYFEDEIKQKLGFTLFRDDLIWRKRNFKIAFGRFSQMGDKVVSVEFLLVTRGPPYERDYGANYSVNLKVDYGAGLVNESH